MGWRHIAKGVICILAFASCAMTGTAAKAQTFHLNGPEYDATLTINGIPFYGTLAREDAAGGWKLTMEGTGQEPVQLGGITLQREWNVTMDLSKEGLTVDPNGRYTGSVQIDVTYDMQPFDQAAFSLVLQAQGDGTDFDAKDVQGWFSHDESRPSNIACRWWDEAFSMYISGLSQENTKTERSMQHTLSYLPCDTTLEVDHTLYYDLPAQGQRYIYTMRPDLQENAIVVRLTDSIGEAPSALPKEPALKLDLEHLLNALANAQAMLRLQQKETLL